MLKHAHLINFKSFADETVDLGPLTLLVGINAAGKSNVLDALWLLHGLSRGLEPDKVLDGEDTSQANGDPWPGIRGGSTEASRLGTSRFEIEISWKPAAESDPETFRVRCSTSPEPRWDSPHGLEALRSGELHALLSRLRLLTIRPERMRGYGQLKRSRLGRDGANFSGALHHLCADPAERQSLVDWLGELLAPEIVDVDFIEVEELGDVMAVFVEKDGKRVSARSLSDGTLRFLGLLLSLRTAEPGATFLIEEIDSGLHPARIHVLMEFLRSVTRELGLQIIATTHAPTVLEALDEETLGDAIVCGRIPEHEGTVMRRLGDLPHFAELVERKGVGELLTTGWLEMAL